MTHIKEEFTRIEKQHGWYQLFQKLDKEHRKKFSEKKMDIASLMINQRLNRFSDVLPYDDTRVRLKHGENDYINANYVQVPSANRKYILTQGPLPSTISHFWQMIWEENSRVIVMLTQLIEKGCSKCHLYYPDDQNEKEFLFQDIDLKVRFRSKRFYRYYTQRQFDLINLSTNESRLIIHWSDFDWPDHGVPNKPTPFLQLLQDVRHCGAFDSRYGAPILHCSAGIGRSGTFVLVDSILKLLAHSTNPSEISLIDTLVHIRTQRCGLIQTVDQLRFSYVTILAGLDMLSELEESERSYLDCDCHLSSDDDDDDEEDLHRQNHPKTCKRQDNIMPNGRLSENFDDINCELMQRTDSSANISQLSPKTTRRLVSLSSEALSNDNDDLKKTVSDIKSRLQQQQQQSCSSYPIKKNISFLHCLTSKYRRSLFVGIFTLFTGTFFLYKYFSKSSRNH